MEIEYPAIKPLKPHASKAYADICAHTNDVFTSRRMANTYGYVPDKHQRKYGQADVTTSAHESTHQINSEIANGGGRHRDKNVGLYVLNNRAFILDEPKPLTIQQVAPKVPDEWRGGILGLYQLYLISQATSWGDRVFYLFDEFSAYTNGSITALQLAEAGELKEARWDSLQGVIYFSLFSCVVFDCLLNPTEEVVKFLKFNLARVKLLYQESQKHPELTHADNTKLINAFYASKYFKPFDSPDAPEGYGFEDYL